MDVTSLSTQVASAAAGRLKLDVATAVLDKALETTTDAASSLLDSLSVVEPPGLTFSRSGLSAGATRRFIADL